MVGTREPGGHTTYFHFHSSNIHFQEGTSKVEVYDSIITVVDPEFSIFDFKLYVFLTYFSIPSLIFSLY